MRYSFIGEAATWAHMLERLATRWGCPAAANGAADAEAAFAFRLRACAAAAKHSHAEAAARWRPAAHDALIDAGRGGAGDP
eukprot:gene2949-26266_t